MRWKEMIIGALVTLAVTVIGGLIVFYSTQEKQEPKIEELTYQKDEQVSFAGKDNNVSIGTIKFANIGSISAKNVNLVLNSSGVEFVEYNIQTSNGATTSSEFNEGKDIITVTLTSLLPQEIVTVTYLLKNESVLDVTMRSNETIGSSGPIYKLPNTRSSLINDFLGDFVPILLIAPLLMLFGVRKLYTTSKPRDGTKNNTAFVLMHSNLVEKAEKMFRRSIQTGVDGSPCLANYAGVLGCLDRFEEADAYLDAANFLSITKHEKALVAFNEAIVAFRKGDIESTDIAFKQAITLSAKEIKLYAKKSKIIHEMASNSPYVKELLKL